jgi:division protein CdvB (Snf7/Vps24/ESCRT-III family)
MATMPPSRKVQQVVPVGAHRTRRKATDVLQVEKLTQHLTTIRHLLEMYRRQLSDVRIRRKLERLTNRLTKIATEVNELDSDKE